MTDTPRAQRALRAVVRLESTLDRVVTRVLGRAGWRPQVVAYLGYGVAPTDQAQGWVRVLARVLLLPRRPRLGDESGGRGWRRFLTIPVADHSVEVEMGGRRHALVTGRSGFLDELVASDLPAGWQDVSFRSGGAPTVRTGVRVVGPDERVGIVSDIDDTVMVTALPRPLLAAWNTFVRHETKRRPVPGMAQFYQRLRDEPPDALVVYLSTGAWNVVPSLVRFLARHGFPAGPLLMTDWGPSLESWFRSGRAHKRTALRRLLRELPQLSWVLVGDDGQHDPQIYDELAAEAPEAVRLIAIRQLSATEQVRTHGTPQPPDEGSPASTGRPAADRVPRITAPDGYGLMHAFSHRGPGHAGPGWTTTSPRSGDGAGDA